MSTRMSFSRWAVWAGLPLAGLAMATLPHASAAAPPSAARPSAKSPASAPAAVPPGTLDPTFGSNGITGALVGVHDMAVAPDGSILSTGAADRSNLTWAVERRTRDGALDPSFGNGGVVSSADGSLGAAQAIALQPDGRIVVAGGWQSAIGTDLMVRRYTADGQLDPTFGMGGSTTVSIADSQSAYDVAIQPDGRIVVVGRVWTAYGIGPVNTFLVVRLLANGTLDPSFGVGGLVTPAFGVDVAARAMYSFGWARSVALQPDGSIVVAGMRGFQDLAVVRLLSNGVLDPTFGTAGMVFLPIRADYPQLGIGLVLTPTRIVIGNGVYAANGDGQCTRFNLVGLRPDGTVDALFGDGGGATVGFGSPDDCSRPGSLVQQADGHLLMAGYTFGGLGSAYHMNGAVARFTADGHLDDTFGDHGLVTGPGRDEAAVVQGSRLVVAGYGSMQRYGL